MAEQLRAHPTPAEPRTGGLYTFLMAVTRSMTSSLNCFSSVPLAVLQLRVKHANETSLGIMWQAPGGEWEKYIISLTDRDLLVIHKSLSKDAREFTFMDLVPGRNYKATITSMSGDLKQSSSTKGRTGNNIVRFYILQWYPLKLARI